MKTIISLLLVFLLSSAAFAQSEKKAIRWGSPDAPKDCCADYVRDNRLHTTYKDDNILFSIGLDVETEKKFVAVLISIGNPNEKSFTIHPENFQMRLTAAKNKVYNALAVEDVAEKIQNRGKWRLLAASFLAGMATRQSTAVVTDNRGNRADVTITEQDREAQNRVNNARREQNAVNQDRADILRTISLPTHTLFKDEVKGGVVFFKKEDLTPGIIISFTVGNTTYEIPFGTDRTANK